MSARPPADSSELVHELLSAARAEVVPAASRERVARQLGIPLPLPGSEAPAAAAALHPPAGSARGASGRRGLDLGWLGVVSALLVGAPGGVPARAEPTLFDPGAEAAPFDRRAEAAPLVRGALAGSLTQPAPAVMPAPANTDDAVPAPAAKLPARRAATAEPRHARAATRAPAPAAPSRLLDEVRQLDRVRALLSRGEGAAALAALDRYQRTFASGELALEARVLRVASEFAVGHRDAARTLARELLAASGTERYRSELRRLMAEQR